MANVSVVSTGTGSAQAEQLRVETNPTGANPIAAPATPLVPTAIATGSSGGGSGGVRRIPIIIPVR